MLRSYHVSRRSCMQDLHTSEIMLVLLGSMSLLKQSVLLCYASFCDLLFNPYGLFFLLCFGIISAQLTTGQCKPVHTCIMLEESQTLNVLVTFKYILLYAKKYSCCNNKVFTTLVVAMYLPAILSC